MGWGEPRHVGAYLGSSATGLRITSNGGPVYDQPTNVNSALCPDLLGYEQIGEADNLRGRVVRAFFWLLRFWPT